MSLDLIKDNDYKVWLADIKSKFQQSQLKASIKVNAALLEFYWELGADIVEKQKLSLWGSGFLKQLSLDLMAEFPSVKGFSKRNLELIRQWHQFWKEHPVIAKQAVSQFIQIPWGHNLKIVSKCQSATEALFYVNSTLEQGWSRDVLSHQIESKLWQRKGNGVNNFSNTLPSVQSDLASQTLKDPYLFDFIAMTQELSERELEKGLVQHMTQFLLELGAGFAYVGKQVPLQVGAREFFLNLLFYHTRLHCYVVVEIKTGDFEPEYAGKLNFYIKAVDEQLRKEGDEATIGILLCKNRDRLVAEYSLSDIKKPIGISEYHLTQSLPENLKSNLPTVEQIEAELSDDFGDDHK